MAVVIGIDPGARYTGVSVRDGDQLLLSSTYVRPEHLGMVTWSVRVSNLIKDEVVSRWPDAVIGIEGIEAPKGFAGGKKQPINPKHIINAAIVLGAIASTFPNAVIVRPGKNGKAEWYPDSLYGRRPKDLEGNADGAGTRNHEKSAFDVAGEAPFYFNDGVVLDERPE